MHHKAIKAEIRKQLKTRYPHWQRLTKKEKKDIAKSFYPMRVTRRPCEIFFQAFFCAPNCSKPSSTRRQAIVNSAVMITTIKATKITAPT